jgi:membrane-anchored glycerophosphoryl diester phosphodiesterase (GDPDase)
MPGNPLTDPNWASDLADTIDLYLGKVRTAVTERAVTVVRAVVFGLIILIIAPVAITLLVIILTQSIQRLIAIFTDHDTAVWMSYMFLAAVFIIGGSILMSKRYIDEEQ